MSESSIIEVNLAAIDHNMRLVQRTVGPRCGICPIIKADGYGLGAVRVARRLESGGAKMLAVFTPRQAGELFAAAVGVPVLVLMPVRQVDRADDLYRALICGRLHLTVHGLDHLEDLIALTERFGTRIHVHLAVDTGMSRGGCTIDEAPGVLRRIAAEPRLRLAGLLTHFAAADRDEDITEQQWCRFHEVISENATLIPSDCIIHAANTFATFRLRRYHRSMVRVGLAWAGYGGELMSGGTINDDVNTLQPTVNWSSRIIHTKRVSRGTKVGYGHTWTAKRNSRIGLVPVGYADGYPLALSGPTGRKDPAQVAVIVDEPGGTRRDWAPVIGAINMDQLTIDLTEIGDAAGVGTTVELIGTDIESPNHLAHLADAAGTLPHAILCGLNPRLRRVYVDAAPLVETVAERTAVAS